MAVYAILGATGNTGTALIQNILRTPDSTIHAYCRNKDKLFRLLPEVIDNKRVNIFDGSITDVDLMTRCLRGANIVFLTVTTNDNIPGCRLSQDSTQTVLTALQKIREEDVAARMPKLVLLSSATLDDHLNREMPGWFKPIMKTAASNVYKDLEITERLLREQSDWLQTIFIKPGGLSVDVQRGHKLSFDDQESFISYLDLAAAMIEAADDPDGRYDFRNVGVVNTGGKAKFPRGTPLSALTLTNQLLQQNHNELHIFFRDMNGHNHLVHNLLTRLALGASPAQLQTAYDDDLPTQRAIPPHHDEVIKNMSDATYLEDKITQINHYPNFLRFFEQQIDAKGWQAVVQEYVFSRSSVAEKILPLMYDGAYHSIIHLGLGVEFNQPSIIAEALAQAAAHDSFETDWFFHTVEKKAEAVPPNESGLLVDLLQEIAGNEALVNAAKTEGFIGTMKMKRCVFATPAGEEMTSIASRFRVTEETLEQRTAEMISFCAYMAGAAQRAGKARKVDFFFMHCVTSSILVSVLARQPWIAVADRVRLVEWKGRLDLAWYAVCGVPALDLVDVENYAGSPSGEMGWTELFRVVNEQHDDGHVAKFVRALKHGEEVSAPYVADETISRGFPVQGDLWLKIARMAYDTTLGLPPMAKWVVMTGMNKAWGQVPSL
ncbi:hypothetical protein BJX96DRAFT_185540 [Aspergillus floccosus]